MAESVAPAPIVLSPHLERFVAQTNIKRFQHMLLEADSAAEQCLIEELLAEEFRKLQQVESGATRPAT